MSAEVDPEILKEHWPENIIYYIQKKLHVLYY